MNQEKCHQILWNHFDYEFDGNKDDMIDAYEWYPQDIMDEDADKDSVEWACWVWHHNLFEM